MIWDTITYLNAYYVTDLVIVPNLSSSGSDNFFNLFHINVTFDLVALPHMSWLMHLALVLARCRLWIRSITAMGGHGCIFLYNATNIRLSFSCSCLVMSRKNPPVIEYSECTHGYSRRAPSRSSPRTPPHSRRNDRTFPARRSARLVIFASKTARKSTRTHSSP